MGGEPLLREDWSTIGRRVRELGMELSIITNGYVHVESKLTEISGINPELVTVSLDGGNPETHDMIRGVQGSFESVINALHRFIDLDIPTAVITTVHKLNLKDLKAIRSLLVGKGIAWQIQMAMPYGRLTREHVLSEEEYYSLALFIASTRRKYSKKDLMLAGAHDMGYFSRLLPPLQVMPWQGCQAGISTLGIQSNGNILGCLALPDEFIEGNVREQSLEEIWNNPRFSSYSRNVRKSDIGGDCISCDNHRICKGGCTAVSYSMAGGLHRDPYCLRRIEERFESED